MLSDNIRNFRKKNNMSQDELAEKLNVSRQSVSLWETGQTQPTIDNITALAKIFNVSADMLLNDNTIDSSDDLQDEPQDNITSKKRKTTIIAVITVAVIAIAVAAVIVLLNGNSIKKNNNNSLDTSVSQSENVSANNTPSGENSNTTNNVSDKVSNSKPTGAVTASEQSGEKVNSAANEAVTPEAVTPTETKVNLFAVCKDFAIKNGTLNGDYSMYQQPSSKYGGYDNEYFSISYWSDSDMVEFGLHCPLSETQSHNFYLRMRGGYNKKYEYASSKYYRDNGESIRFANGYIDPAVFSENYPISCDVYEGSSDGQNEFMEESRVGICDLIKCIKNFVATENIECDFSDFDFANF